MSESNYIVLDVETNGIPSKRIDSRSDVCNHISAYDGLHVIELAFLHPQTCTELATLLHHTDPKFIDLMYTTRFHGITKEMIDATGRPAIDVFREFYAFLVKHNIQTIVAHNVEFDMGFLISESIFYGLPELTKLLTTINIVCTMKDARVSRFMGSSKWPKLIEVFRKITHESPKIMHRALQDCRSCHVIYKHLFLDVHLKGPDGPVLHELANSHVCK